MTLAENSVRNPRNGELKAIGDHNAVLSAARFCKMGDVWIALTSLSAASPPINQNFVGNSFLATSASLNLPECIYGSKKSGRSLLEKYLVRIGSGV